jgi:hypothetical protein
MRLKSSYVSSARAYEANYAIEKRATKEGKREEGRRSK